LDASRAESEILEEESLLAAAQKRVREHFERATIGEKLNLILFQKMSLLCNDFFWELFEKVRKDVERITEDDEAALDPDGPYLMGLLQGLTIADDAQ